MFHEFQCLMDLALTYSMGRPKLARSCAYDAFCVARSMRRPDLTLAANTLLGVL